MKWLLLLFLFYICESCRAERLSTSTMVVRGRPWKCAQTHGPEEPMPFMLRLWRYWLPKAVPAPPPSRLCHSSPVQTPCSTLASCTYLRTSRCFLPLDYYRCFSGSCYLCIAFCFLLFESYGLSLPHRGLLWPFDLKSPLFLTFILKSLTLFLFS